MPKSKTLRIAIRKYDPFEMHIDKTWKAYCELTGCDLQLEAVPMDLTPLYDSTIKNKGLASGAWDIAHINTDWIAETHSEGLLENLAPWIDKNPPDDFPQGWSKSLLEMQNFDDVILGLPFHDGPECLIYRKDLFDSAEEQKKFYAQTGRPLTVPATWDELMEVAAFFTRPEQSLWGTTFAAFPDGHNTVFDFCLQVWTRGGEVVDKNGKIIIDSIESRQGMSYYRKALQNTSAIHPDSKQFDSVNAGMAFASGQLAMMVNWFSFASMCEVIPDSRVKGCVDIANVPAGPEGKGVSLNAYWFYTIASGSKKKDVAYDFIRFAVNRQNDKLLTLEGGIGCRKSTWNDPEINQTVPYYNKLELLHQNTRALPRMHNWTDIAHIIDAMVMEVMDSGEDIIHILQKAQARVDKLLNQ